MTIATVQLWLGLASPAHAGQLVVHEGDAARVIDEVVRHTGRLTSDFTAMSLADVLNGKLPTLSAGKVERCTAGPSPAADVEKHLAAAQESIDAKEPEFALGPARAADKAALCADAPVPATVLAKVAFANGLASHANGDIEGSKAAFKQAIWLDPLTDWAAATPEAMRADLAAAAELAAKREVTLVLFPGDGGSIDGKPVTQHPTVAVGTHWVELGGVWMRVTIEAPTAANPVLVVPAAVTPGATAWAADPAKAPDLVRLLDALVPDVAYVVADDEVWKRTEAGGFDEVRPPKKGFEPGIVVAPLGAVVTAGGAVLAFTALGAGKTAVDTASAPGVTQADFDSAQADYDGAKTRLIAGDALMAAGVVLAGIGGGLLLDGAHLGPYFTPGGAGIGLSVGGGR